MKLYVLIGQRKQRYEGECGIEALACMSEYDQESNEHYLPEQTAEYEASRDFEALRVVTLEVSEKALRSVLFPENTPIPVVVKQESSS